MTVLGIEGALGGFSTAVVRNGRPLAAREARGNVALESGLEMVRDVLDEAGCPGARLDRIAVGIGPGGFTGLRIAIAYAKSLAQAWRLPLVPLNSFDLLEFNHELEPLLAVVLGRKGVISARYRGAAGERRESGPIGEVLDAILPGPGPEPLRVAGAAEDVLAALGERGYIVEPLRPTALPAVTVALLGARRSAAPHFHAVRADYGELPAATVPKF